MCIRDSLTADASKYLQRQCCKRIFQFLYLLRETGLGHSAVVLALSKTIFSLDMLSPNMQFWISTWLIPYQWSCVLRIVISLTLKYVTRLRIVNGSNNAFSGFKSCLSWTFPDLLYPCHELRFSADYTVRTFQIIMFIIFHSLRVYCSLQICLPNLMLMHYHELLL